MKKISNLLIASGILIFMGTAGASDKESIEFAKILSQILLGICLIAAGNIFKTAYALAKAVKKRSKVRQIPYFGEVK